MPNASGRHAPESVVGMNRNWWSACIGIGGRHGPDYANNKDEPRGIVISNIRADYFLNDIRNFQRQGEVTFFINNDGYYLTHPDKTKEFAFMFNDKDDNFSKDYPEVASKVMEKCDERRAETDNFIWRLYTSQTQ